MGKGSTYRPTNKKISDENHDRIFGIKEPTEFQNCNKYVISTKDKKNDEKIKNI